MSSSSKPSMASEPETKRPALLAAAASEPTGAATPKSTRGRKPTAKAQGGGPGGAKKPPQRGLGVAQLERLRLQERWKKMTEMPPPPPPPLESVPVQFGAGGFGGAAAGRLVLGGPFGSPPSGVVVDHGSLVDPRGRSVYNHGMVVGAPNHHHHHDHDDQEYVNHQAARELSSTPKNHNTTVVVGSDEQSFDFCSFKKKRFNGEINGNGLNLYCLNNTDQNNLNNPNNNNMNIGDHLTLGFGTSNSKVPRSSPSSHIVQNLDYPHEGVEVVAVHRKGINGGSDNQDNVVMEYRFFPGQAGVLGKNDVVSSSSSSSTGTGFKKNFHEKIWPYTEIGSVSVGELEASYFTNNVSATTTTTTSSYNIGADNCNPLDLSLKL